MISLESNQPLPWPRSSINCKAPSPTASTMKPVQSKRSFVSRTVSRRNIQMPVTEAMPNGTLT